MESFQSYGNVSYDFSETGSDYIDENGNAPISVDPSTLRLYKFVTRLQVFNGARMDKWGVVVKLYSPQGTQILSRRVPINKCQSGTYTLVFSFITNWQATASDQYMEYKVTPYWTDLNGGKNYSSIDSYSKAKYKLYYECTPDITPTDVKKGESKWGEIQSEIELK